MSKHFTLPYDGGLIEKGLPKGILHSYERISTEIYKESRLAAKDIADIIVNAVNNAPEGRLFRLGLTTGATPQSLYNELARRYQAGDVSFKNVEVVSIDEYYPSAKEERQSRNFKLHESFLDTVDIKEENIHIPDGTVPQDQVSEYCAQYDKIATGLELLVIGMGEQGQVGFNEAGSTPKSRTRTVRLSYKSRKRQAKNFNHDISLTPDKAITIGIGTMLSAGRIILMAGSGVTEQNIRELHEVTGLHEFHFSAREPQPSAMQYVNPNLYMGRPGANEAALDYTTACRVAATIAQLLD